MLAVLIPVLSLSFAVLALFYYKYRQFIAKTTKVLDGAETSRSEAPLKVEMPAISIKWRNTSGDQLGSKTSV